MLIVNVEYEIWKNILDERYEKIKTEQTKERGPV